MIGRKVTVILPERPGYPRFLRCYVIRRVGNGWQLYDPVRNWSWGVSDEKVARRVVFA